MADSDEDRLRALRSRQHGGAYQEAPLPAAAQQKLASAGAGRNIRGTGNAGAGPSRAVAEPAVRKDTKTGKAVINLNTAAEQDTEASIARERVTNAKVHRDPRAAQSPLYNAAGPKPEPVRAGLGAATDSDAQWNSQVKAVSEHIAEHHPHGGVGGVAIEHTQAGAPKPLSRDKITDLAERHLMGSARIPGLKAKSHEATESTPPGLSVSPATAAQNNNALKVQPASQPSLTTGNESATPIPSKYQGKKAPVRTSAVQAPAAPAAPARPERTPRDFSGMTARSSAESRQGRRLERAAAYSESSAGESRREHYQSNVPAASTKASKTAQGVLHAERLSSPVNHGQFGQAAGRMTSAVHSGLSAQTPPEPKAPRASKAETPAAPAPAEAKAPVQPAAVEASPQLGTPGKLTMLTKPGTKGATPPHMVSSAPERGQLSPQMANKHKRSSAPVEPEAPKPEIMAPPAKAEAPAVHETKAPAPVASAPAPQVTPQAPSAPAASRRPVAPAPAAEAAVQPPRTTKPLPETPRQAPAAAPQSPSSVAMTPETPAPSKTRGPASGSVPSPVAQSRQLGGHTVHNHYYGNVNQGGVQFNGDVSGGVSGISVSGGANHMPSGGRVAGGSGRAGGSRGASGPVTGTPTGLQKAAYGALHTSVNGHSIAGAVEHVTGGGHIGMEDQAGNPIGHPHDAFVQHHGGHQSTRGPQQSPVNSGQFSQARASRQQATP